MIVNRNSKMTYDIFLNCASLLNSNYIHKTLWDKGNETLKIEIKSNLGIKNFLFKYTEINQSIIWDYISLESSFDIIMLLVTISKDIKHIFFDNNGQADKSILFIAKNGTIEVIN